MDISINNQGSIILFRPHTKEAREWMEANVSDDATWFGGALVVEPRYAGDLANGMKEEGFTLG